MSNLITLPALGAALLVATGTGVYLGESSIELIKPVYFQGPALHPRDRGAALDPNAIRARAPAFTDLYGWVEGDAALVRDCGDCAALQARDSHAYSAVVPYFGPGEDARGAVRQASVEPEFVEQAPSEASKVAARLERYANSPVSADEASPVRDYKSGDVYLGEGGPEEVASDDDE